MRGVSAGLCAAVLLLGGCSSATTESPAASTTVLDKITPQRMCDFVDGASIKKAVGAAPDGADSRRVGKAPITITYTCAYRMSVPALTTEVSTTERNPADKQVLDEAFVDHVKSRPVTYDAVPGVGVLAGYGPDPTLSGADVDAHQLAVVFRVGDERLLLAVSVLGNATAAGLKPVAAEFLKNFANAVR